MRQNLLSLARKDTPGGVAGGVTRKMNISDMIYASVKESGTQTLRVEAVPDSLRITEAEQEALREEMLGRIGRNIAARNRSVRAAGRMATR